MNIRAYEPSDLDELKRMHEKYYTHEFSLPDFLTNFFCAIAVGDEKGTITFSGVRPIAEAIAVTDKDRSPRIRREALYYTLSALSNIATRFDFNQLHAFVQDEQWLKHLRGVGFHPTKGQALVLDL